MLVLSIIFFAIAALIGLALAYLRLADKPLSTGLAVIHGIAAVVGLILLIIFMANVPERVPLLWAALVLFVLAAGGGAIMFFGFHLRKKKLPVPLMILHAILAIVGWVLLLIVLMGHRQPAPTNP